MLPSATLSRIYSENPDGGGAADALVPVPVDLEELGDALEGDPLDATGGGIIDLDSGEVFVECVIDYMRDDQGIDLYETRERILDIERLGSHAAYQDMLDYIDSLTDKHLAELLMVPVAVRPAWARTAAIDHEPVRDPGPQPGRRPRSPALAARSRVQARNGSWLLLYGTPLSGEPGRTAVIVQPAAPAEIAPLVALAYGLSGRERQITGLCIRGASTKQIAHELAISPYTVQDHLKAIFDKTGVRSRGERVSQIFLEHCVPRWEQVSDPPRGWYGFDGRTAVEPPRA